MTPSKQVCRSSLFSGRNIRWARRMLPLLTHGEYDDGTDRRTDGRTPDRYITLLATDAASVKIKRT